MISQEHGSLIEMIPPAALEAAGRLFADPGETILRADAPASHFYLLEAGSAKLVCEPIDSPPLIIDIYHAGDFFGEMEMVGLEIKDRSVVALTACELLCFTRDQFFHLWDQERAFSRTILAVHCRRLLAAGDDKVYTDGTLLSQRVLRVIHGHTSPGGWFLYTKQILAELTGISGSSRNRTLKALQLVGLIALQAGAIRMKY